MIRSHLTSVAVFMLLTVALFVSPHGEAQVPPGSINLDKATLKPMQGQAATFVSGVYGDPLLAGNEPEAITWANHINLQLLPAYLVFDRARVVDGDFWNNQWR